MVKILFMAILGMCVLLLDSCEREYEKDTTIIAKNDFALIQLESDICKNSAFEMGCLKHLRARIQ